MRVAVTWAGSSVGAAAAGAAFGSEGWAGVSVGASVGVATGAGV